MSSPTFTPGPWRANRKRYIKAENGCTVAQVRGPSGRGKEYAEELPFADANARLIAAAPELFDTLQALVVAVTYGDPPTLFNEVLCHEARVPVEFVTEARAALAKANPSVQS